MKEERDSLFLMPSKRALTSETSGKSCYRKVEELHQKWRTPTQGIGPRGGQPPTRKLPEMTHTRKNSTNRDHITERSICLDRSRGRQIARLPKIGEVASTTRHLNPPRCPYPPPPTEERRKRVGATTYVPKDEDATPRLDRLDTTLNRIGGLGLDTQVETDLRNTPNEPAHR